MFQYRLVVLCSVYKLIILVLMSRTVEDHSSSAKGLIFSDIPIVHYCLVLIFKYDSIHLSALKVMPKLWLSRWSMIWWSIVSRDLDKSNTTSIEVFPLFSASSISVWTFCRDVFVERYFLYAVCAESVRSYFSSVHLVLRSLPFLWSWKETEGLKSVNN